MQFDDIETTCPYCNEAISIPIDPGGGDTQETIVDCEVCCKPITVHSSWDARTENYEIEVDRS